MEIIEQSKDYTKKEMYNLTIANTTITLKEIPDEEHLIVRGYIRWKNDEGLELLSLDTDKGAVVTQSPSFTLSFNRIWDFFSDTLPINIQKVTGTSKNGREYMDCIIY